MTMNPLPRTPRLGSSPRTARLRQMLTVGACSLLSCSLGVQAQHTPVQTAAIAPCGLDTAVDKNGVVTLTLNSSAGTGYAWTIDLGRNQHVHLLDQGAQSLNTDPDMIGGPVRQWWKVQVVGSKQANIDFLLFRPWEEKENAAQRCVAHVVMP